MMVRHLQRAIPEILVPQESLLSRLVFGLFLYVESYPRCLSEYLAKTSESRCPQITISHSDTKTNRISDQALGAICWKNLSL